MEELLKLIEQLSPEKRTLLGALLLRTAGRDATTTRDPIAIIGVGCRFPGDADSPEAFWQLLCEGKDAITEVSGDRWDVDAFYNPDPNVPGTMCTRWGGFLRAVDTFDPQFFGISPREALTMDPQQRLLLEVAWEALEDAGQSVQRLSGSRTGVFIGIGTGDYMRLLRPDEPENLRRYDIYAGTGSSLCIAANRISYLWNLRGPSMAVDTACSSSLVAVHLACQSLWSGESTLALAGGVNVLVLPSTTVLLNRFLAPDGRCKTFDARANGYVRGEGAGVVVLKPLSRAVADGDPIYAVIRGSAINQDGYSSGLTVPNGVAQQAVLRDALASAGVEPAQLSYLETHGSGTSLGDPVEANALGAVLGEGRAPGDRCALGSVKSNIGHLEAAAGIAGLIKVALALKHKQLPPSLHFEVPNPNIPFSELPLRVQTSLAPWEPASGSRFAGVSSFGIGGTNAHVVLAEAPERPQREEAQEDDRVHLLPLSARSADALAAMARSYRDLLTTEDAPPALRDVCYTAGARRDHHDHRLAAFGQSAKEVAAALSAFVEGAPHAGLSSGTRPRGPARRIVFVCAGQGELRPGVARELLRDAPEPAFCEALERVDALVRERAGFSVLDALWAADARSRLDQTEVAQPVLFALQVALAALWRSWGVAPDALIGHSVGEVAAAHLSGALSLEDAVQVVVHRGRLMQRATGLGGMLAVALPVAHAQRLVANAEGRVSIAAINSPSSTVLSGERTALEAARRELEAHGIPHRALPVDYAFHSAQMDPFRAPLARVLEGLAPSPLSVPVFSTTTGLPAGPGSFDAEHWARNLREPVLFEAAVSRSIDEGYDLFLELGPHPVLSKAISECLDHKGREAVVLPSLRRDRPERATLLSSLAELYTIGHPVEWEPLCPDGRCTRLPAYPWQRQRYWMDAVERPSERTKTERSKDERPAATSFPSAFYDVAAAQSEDVQSPVYEENYQIFAPFFDVVEGFSWPLVYRRPSAHPEHFARMLDAQKEMKAALFRHVDFSSCSRVLDFGCGFSTDLIALAEAHPHLELVGYSISSGHLEVGRKRALARGLGARITLEHKDSAKDEFPGTFDLAMGFEVTHHIKDKPSLFANLGRHLKGGGLLVLADFISNGDTSIDHDETSSYFATRDQWVDLLADNQLRAMDCVDVSQEIANFLHHEDFEATLAAVDREVGDANFRAAMRSYYQLGKLLRKGLASYVLLVAKKQPDSARAELAAANQAALGELIPYEEVAGSRWLYEVAWQPKARDGERDGQRDAERAEGDAPSHREADVAQGDWLVLADEGGLGQRLATLLQERGGRCVLVHAGAAYERLAAGQFSIDADDPEHYARILSEAFGASGCTGVVHLWSLDDTSPMEAGSHATGTDRDPKIETAIARSTGSALLLVQALARTKWTRPARDRGPLWIVTRGAQPVADNDRLSLSAAPLWGLGRVVAEEHPELWGGLVDLDPRRSSEARGRPSDVSVSSFEMAQARLDEATLLVDELTRPDGEDAVALRGDQRNVARLVRIDGRALPQAPTALREDGTYLVTGGLGALGLHVARWMVRRGARHLVLVGRSSASADMHHALARLEAQGARIVVASADVSREAELREVLAEVRRTMPPLRGVVHAAGVVDDGVLLEQDWARFTQVMAPKVDGAWNLHSLTRSDPLELFVLFSAGVSLIGAPGQSSYVAANAFLDALAHHRRALGLPALSVNWGLWAHGGMAASLRERDKRRWEERGARLLPPEQALSLMERLLQTPRAQAGVMSIAWAKFAAGSAAGGARRLLSDLFEEARVRSARRLTSDERATLIKRLAEAYPNERPEILATHVRSHVNRVLGIDPDFALDPRTPLLSLGMDSLMAVELRNALGRALGRSLPATLLFDHPTLEALVVRLRREVLEEEVAPTSEPAEDSEDDDLDATLAGIEQLSEAEAEALLAERLVAQGG